MPTPLDPEHVDLIKVVGARRAALLAAAAASVATDIRHDADLLTTSPVRPRRTPALRVLHLLPAITWEQSMFWRYQLAEAADRIAADTSRWGAPVPRCTGEEMALHLALRRAKQTDTGSRRQWDDLDEHLFQDEDVLMLYDLGSIAGGMGVHLRPNEWFTEFGTPFPVPDRQTIGGGEPDGH